MSRELLLPGHNLSKYTASGTIINGDSSTTLVGYAWGDYTYNAEFTNDFIPIVNTGKTYYYDIVFSSQSGNLLYIGFERYDASKHSTSNNSCTYVYSGTAERNNYRISGTVNLAKDASGNETKFISLRILNDWNNSGNNYTSTFYNISLREVDTINSPKVLKSGIVSVDDVREIGDVTKFYKTGFLNTTEIKEF